MSCTAFWCICFVLLYGVESKNIPQKGILLPIKEIEQLAEEQHQLKGQDPEVTPGLYEGDMAGVNEKMLRLGLNWQTFPDRQWPNRTIPYVISPLYVPRDFHIIMTAIRVLNFMTCVNFVPWDGNATDYLIIWPMKQPSGCWSFVGRWGGPQVLSLQAPDEKQPNCLAGIGRAVHELLHALGIFHEQSRFDRDDFVTIFPENVITDYLSNFDKHSLENTSYEYPYDYNSIMHYGTHYFSKSKDKPTVVPKTSKVRIGQRWNMNRQYEVNFDFVKNQSLAVRQRKESVLHLHDKHLDKILRTSLKH